MINAVNDFCEAFDGVGLDASHANLREVNGKPQMRVLGYRFLSFQGWVSSRDDSTASTISSGSLNRFVGLRSRI